MSETKTLKHLSNPETKKSYYTDRRTFLKAVEQKITDLTSISNETKLLLSNLITTKKLENLKWQVEWTMKEQEKFSKKLEEVENKKAHPSEKDKEFADILNNEITKEDIEAFLRSSKYYKRENAPIENEDLQNKLVEDIIVFEDDTVWKALSKMSQNKYNFVILIDKNWVFNWIFTKHEIYWIDPNIKLNEISDKKILDASGKGNIKNKEASELMIKYWINALPIVNKKWILTWILSIGNLEKNITKNKCVLSLTKFNLSNLIYSRN
ncbi:MAG: hypothetical protein ACD_4C00313G0001 [uncultured bacterium (gcode 4)]|uniref:CBS domain-containing protein n=1 Tax=uncultured bacterium (gcode 4) TaxID=1234023 RepID=K2G8A8_9BACT|nr:MAG: hypothetical protein ACD_4C00313G0001 [uncultured bacterium (gcode 4)]